MTEKSFAVMIKKINLILLIVFFSASNCPLSHASPWAERPTYAGKTAGKLWFGVKNSVCGWMAMFVEAEKKTYPRKWNGFCVGIARSIVYTANGLVHLATFPIPVDFPNVGKGLGIPETEKPSAKLARQKQEALEIQAEIKKAEYETKKPKASGKEPIVIEVTEDKATPVLSSTEQAVELEKRRQTMPDSGYVPKPEPIVAVPTAVKPEEKIVEPVKAAVPSGTVSAAKSLADELNAKPAETKAGPSVPPPSPEKTATPPLPAPKPVAAADAAVPAPVSKTETAEEKPAKPVFKPVPYTLPAQPAAKTAYIPSFVPPSMAKPGPTGIASLSPKTADEPAAPAEEKGSVGEPEAGADDIAKILADAEKYYKEGKK